MATHDDYAVWYRSEVYLDFVDFVDGLPEPQRKASNDALRKFTEKAQKTQGRNGQYLKRLECFLSKEGPWRIFYEVDDEVSEVDVIFMVYVREGTS